MITRLGTSVALAALLLGLTGCAGVVQALKNEPCQLDARQPFTTVEVDPTDHDVRIYWQDLAGEPFLTLDAVRRHVEAAGDSLVAATNAGIYEPGYVPTGLLIIEREELVPLNVADGAGNFFLKPNGVFSVREHGTFRIDATEEWTADGEARYATQSGPLLLHRGERHPRFLDGSTNCRLRSGVGVREDGTAVFAISNGAVNFHDFAVFFRDELGVSNALYLDGGRSKMLFPGGGRFEDGQFAAIIAIVAK